MILAVQGRLHWRRVHDEDARYPHPLSIQHSIFSSLKDKVLRSPIEIASNSGRSRPQSYYRVRPSPACRDINANVRL
jgi:hypothetical protein